LDSQLWYPHFWIFEPQIVYSVDGTAIGFVT
jgi:hypothetical protein